MGRVTAALALAALLATAVARAQPSPKDREAAHALMDDADKKIEAKDYAGALERYRAADAIMGVPTTGIEVARTLALLGKLLEAREVARRIAATLKKQGEPAPFAEAREAAATLARKLDERVPKVRIVIEGLAANAAVDVRVDGLPAAPGELREVDPGEHVVVTIAKGFARDERIARAEEGRTTGVTIALVAEATKAREPIASIPERATSPLVWTGFGVAILGAAVGAVTGIVSLDAASSAKARCVNDVCPRSAAPDIDRSKAFANASNVAFAIGGAGVVIGVIGVALSVGQGGANVAVARAF